MSLDLFLYYHCSMVWKVVCVLNSHEAVSLVYQVSFRWLGYPALVVSIDVCVCFELVDGCL